MLGVSPSTTFELKARIWPDTHPDDGIHPLSKTADVVAFIALPDQSAESTRGRSKAAGE
jgi:hypothetical protein